MSPAPSPRPSRTRIVALGAVILAAVAALWWRRTPPAPAPAVPQESASNAPVEPAPLERAPEPARFERAPERQDTVAPDAGAGSPDLHSAEATVETQVQLLRSGRDAEFIATFLPEARERLTPRALERCRARVITSGTPLVPDWEMAEESQVDGHRVRRVSMYGHETTGFHEIDGQWLADRAWCVPTSVPDDAAE